MRYGTGGLPIVLGIALISGCVDRTPPDNSPPASASNVEFKMNFYHHSMRRSSSIADPASETFAKATTLWRTQCSIVLLHYTVGIENLDGEDEAQNPVKLGDKFASTTVAGIRYEPNWTRIRDRQARRNQSSNKGGDAYYSWEIYHAGPVTGVTYSFGANRSVILSSAWKNEPHYDLVLPHEIGHMLSLDHNKAPSLSNTLMFDQPFGGTILSGRQPDGTFAISSECQRARQHGYSQQFFIEYYAGF